MVNNIHHDFIANGKNIKHKFRVERSLINWIIKFDQYNLIDSK